MLVSCLPYSSTLKMEAKCSSETQAAFQRTKLRYISEDRTFHNHCSENLKPYKHVILKLQYFFCINCVLHSATLYCNLVCQLNFIEHFRLNFMLVNFRQQMSLFIK
jgi:hypothetical protein